MDDQLTSRERAMFASLPRHRLGSAALEDRVVHALVERGLLRRVTMAFGRSSWRVLGQLTAAALVFVIGVVVGRTGQAADLPVTSSSDLRPGVSGMETASSIFGVAMAGVVASRNGGSMPLLRRVGTVSVGAIVMLPADTVDVLSRIARDVARMTYNAAALQLARTHRDTVVAWLRSSNDVFAMPSP